MADEAKQDDAHVFTDNGDGVVREWDADLNHVTTHRAGGKSPGSVGEIQKDAYETAPRNIDKATKPAKTKYEPFRW